MIDTRRLFAQLLALTRQDIQEAAVACRGRPTAADDVAWWTATAHVERLLRRQRTRRVAAAAASSAARAVQDAARNAGLAIDDPDVVHVARAASDATAAIIAGPDAQADAAYFLARLRPAPERDYRWLLRRLVGSGEDGKPPVLEEGGIQQAAGIASY